MADDTLDSPAGTSTRVASVSSARGSRRPLRSAGLVLGGLGLGLLGPVLAASRSVVHGTTVPWGVVLVLVTVLACTRGAAWLVGSRRGAALVGIGWVVPTLVLATTNPGGDVLLPDVARSYVYLVGATLLVVLAVAVPLPRGARELADADHADHADVDPAATVQGDG